MWSCLEPGIGLVGLCESLPTRDILWFSDLLSCIQGNDVLHTALLVPEHQITFSSSFCPDRV